MGKVKFGKSENGRKMADKPSLSKEPVEVLSQLSKEDVEAILLPHLEALKASIPVAMDIKPCVCPAPSIVEPKTIVETVHIRDERPIIDQKARMHSQLVRQKLEHFMKKTHTVTMTIPAEKQRVTELRTTHEIVVEKNSKLLIAGIILSLTLNVLILIIK